MSLSFTLTQMEQFAFSESIYYKMYFEVRKLFNFQPGVKLSGQCALDWVTKLDFDAYPQFEGLSLNDFKVVVEVHAAWDHLRVILRAYRAGKATIATLRKARAAFIATLSKVPV